MRIVCVSDTHNLHDKIVVPDGDVLIHAGDGTGTGTVPQIVALDNWFASLPHKNKFYVPGNHDFLFERRPERARVPFTHATILQDSMAEVDGITIYGTPWSPTFCGWAFMRYEQTLREMFKDIPEVDILVTHTPPYGVMDNSLGSKALAEVLKDRQLKLHVFGHIHEGYGIQGRAVNASICDEFYRPVNKAIVVDL